MERRTWGRLSNPIGVPAILIGMSGESSLVVYAGPNSASRCQIRYSPSAAADRMCPPPSQRYSALCGRLQSPDSDHPVTLLIQQRVDAEAFPARVLSLPKTPSKQILGGFTSSPSGRGLRKGYQDFAKHGCGQKSSRCTNFALRHITTTLQTGVDNADCGPMIEGHLSSTKVR